MHRDAPGLPDNPQRPQSPADVARRPAAPVPQPQDGTTLHSRRGAATAHLVQMASEPRPLLLQVSSGPRAAVAGRAEALLLKDSL